MNGASSVNSLAGDRGQNIESVVWLDTFYFGIPFDISDTSDEISETYKVKTTFSELFLEVEILRLRGPQFKIICTLIPGEDFIPNGKYKIQFHYDINIIDQDTKVFDMPFHGFAVFESFLFDFSNLENFLLPGLQGEFEFKILVKMIEYDSVLTSKHIVLIDNFRTEYAQIFKNKSVLDDLCYILKVRRLEDIFIGRQNTKYMKLKGFIIAKTAPFSRQIAHFLECIGNSTTPPYINLDGILNYLSHGKKDIICEESLMRIYLLAHYLGLNFLIVLSRHCILERVEEYYLFDISTYESFMINVLKRLFQVNDECLLQQLEANLDRSNIFTEANLVEKFQNESISSRFVLLYLKRRFKRQRSNSSSIGIGEASSSNDFLDFLDLDI